MASSAARLPTSCSRWVAALDVLPGRFRSPSRPRAVCAALGLPLRHEWAIKNFDGYPRFLGWEFIGVVHLCADASLSCEQPVGLAAATGRWRADL
jgi:hypothetical protein